MWIIKFIYNIENLICNILTLFYFIYLFIYLFFGCDQMLKWHPKAYFQFDINFLDLGKGIEYFYHRFDKNYGK